MNQFTEYVFGWIQIFLPIFTIGLTIAVARSFLGIITESLKHRADIKHDVFEVELMNGIITDIEEPTEKPKREFVEHDGELLEVVEYEKPKRSAYDD